MVAAAVPSRDAERNLRHRDHGSGTDVRRGFDRCRAVGAGSAAAMQREPMLRHRLSPIPSLERKRNGDWDGAAHGTIGHAHRSRRHGAGSRRLSKRDDRRASNREAEGTGVSCGLNGGLRDRRDGDVPDRRALLLLSRRLDAKRSTPQRSGEAERRGRGATIPVT